LGPDFELFLPDWEERESIFFIIFVKI